MKALLTVVLSVLLFSCATISPYGDLGRGVQLSPLPGIYHIWWKKNEECSGIKGARKPKIYLISQDWFTYDATGSRAIGLYKVDSLKNGKVAERIYLIRQGAMTEWLVRHEMLHSLVPPDTSLKDPWHPPLYFREKCRLMPDQQTGR